jgi:hypothetical protein
MQYRISAWRTIGARRDTITQDKRPACRNWQGAAGACTTKPDHVITYTRNLSTLPGQGRELHAYACYRHLHSAITYACGVAPYVTVTPYTGA